MPHRITVLDFDQVYQNQTFLKDEACDWIDLQSIPNTNLFCEKNTLKEIAMKLKKYRNNKICLIGSGNYHHMTYILLSFMKKPFTLILFDHHTDMLKSPSETLISCGSWVLEALQNIPHLKKVLIIGVHEKGDKHIPYSFRRKIRLYTKRLLHWNFDQVFSSIQKEIPTEDVYISIDKDVLHKKDALTAWDHGDLRLHQLMTIVESIFKHKWVNRIDICGEFPHTPLNMYERDAQVAHRKNSYVNHFIIKNIMRLFKDKYGSIDLLHA